MPEATMGHPPPDQSARDAIIHERESNVAVIAGAGTGKTQTIIARAVELLAPHAADALPLQIERMALITFTRRAAGELRFRIREQLLRELEKAARSSDGRAERLRRALGHLDAAFIGTIHGFADRLLRLRPVEAELSPAYVLLDDTSELVSETFWRLRRAAETETLSAELGRYASSVPTDLIAEAAETLRAAARAGLQLQRGDGPHGPIASLEAIVARMIETRDIALDVPPLPDPDLADARAAVDKLRELVARMYGKEHGHRQLRRVARHLERLHRIDDAAEAVRLISEALPRRGLLKGRDFRNDPVGWAVWKTIDPDIGTSAWILDRLKGSHRWLAARFVRLFPVVNALYEQVKAEHEVADYLDLLVRLRNLLRDNREARCFYQGLFDHIFVDEFQDTDPLQCEIVFYLCEQGATAEGWEKVDLTPGKLTIVGDPKQSIFRFRRADIAMYGRAMELLHGHHALEQRLQTNFRSRPNLIEVFNRQLAGVLGKSGNEAFDPTTGRANYEDLQAAPAIAPSSIAMDLLPYADGADEGLLAGDGRAVEAQMIARYVSWLLASQQLVRDPDSGIERPVQLGDIAVIANVTTNLPLLLRALDALGIEYTARGGTLFLGHPVVRQYLLALRALADVDDGVAEAALLRPPFFALDLADLVAALANREKGDDERTRRATEAREIIKHLRARRHAQSPGATARDLIERTALGRAVVADRNGKQALAALYEVAAEIDRRAALDGLDYDAMTELARIWATDPVYVDAPEPTGARVLRIMTIHSAKGLEFPVVILWDGFQVLSERAHTGWLLERSGQAWALGLGSVAVEYPRGGNLGEREKQFGEQECRRKYYVAATRARDLLVLPLPLTKSRTLQYATTVLGGQAEGASVRRFETFRMESPPAWAVVPALQDSDSIQADVALQDHAETVRCDFARVIDAATQPIAVPVAVTAAAARARPVGDSADASELAQKVAGARFGPVFGTTVHRALDLLLSGSISDVPTALRLGADESQLSSHLDEAEADVRRALATLREQTLPSAGAEVATEYAIVGAWLDGQLLTGFIDLLIVDASTVTVIDFKTDAARPGALATTYPEYDAQLRLYGKLLDAAGVIGTRAWRCGLLFTATGELRWADAGSSRP